MTDKCVAFVHTTPPPPPNNQDSVYTASKDRNDHEIQQTHQENNNDQAFHICDPM